MVKCLFFSIFAGVFGTGFGGLISIFTKKHTSLYPKALFFSAGFMLAVVCFELIPESLAYGDLQIVTISYAIGVGMIIVGNLIFEHMSKSLNSNYKSAFLIMLAIALHNFPEGLAIGGGEIGGFGLSIMILMLLHNIPEGMTVALPLLKNGTSSFKAIMFASLSGVPTVLGAILGYSFALTSTTYIAVSLAVAAGCMTYVTFVEILPEGFSSMKNTFSVIFLLLGFSIGMLFCQIV